MNIHIVGGGIAGLAAAYALSDNEFNVHLWERENLICMHSSSKNAAIFRTYESDPTLSFLVKESFRELLQIEKMAGKLLDRRGLLIDPLELDYYEEHYPGYATELLGIRSDLQRHTLPDGSAFNGYYVRDNGIIDIHALQSYLLRQITDNGVKIFYNSEVSGFTIEDGNIQTFEAKNGNKIDVSDRDIIINASGAWAVDILQKSKIWLPPMAPYKRHLYYIKNKLVNNTEGFPVLWNEKRDVYIRPEGTGFLATHCDQRETIAGDYTPDEKEVDKFLRSVTSVFPFLGDYYISRYWACLRTFTLDQHPVIGFDPHIKNLFWVAGLGGRGMTVATGIIPVIRKLITEKNNRDRNPYSPIRFIY